MIASSFNADPDFLTMDGVTQNAVVVSLPADNTSLVGVSVLARGLTDGTSALWDLLACVKRDGGAASLVGSVVSVIAPLKDAGATGWNATLTIADGTLVVQVTGDLLQRVGWQFDVRVDGFNDDNVTDANLALYQVAAK